MLYQHQHRINKIIEQNSDESMNTSRHVPPVLPPSPTRTNIQSGKEVTDSLILGLMNNPDFANPRGQDVLDKCLPFQDHIKDRLAREVRTFNPTVDHSLSESCAHALRQVKDNCERDRLKIPFHSTDARYSLYVDIQYDSDSKELLESIILSLHIIIHVKQ